MSENKKYLSGKSCTITCNCDLSGEVIIQDKNDNIVSISGDDMKKFIAGIMIEKIASFGNIEPFVP